MLFNAPANPLLIRSLMVLALATVSTVNSNLVHATTPTSTLPGTITLYGKTGDISDPENDSNSHCVIEVLPGGTGRTVDYMLSNPDSKCFQLRVESISMEHMPPATQVLLTDDYFCDTTLGDDYQPKLDPSTNKNFWIKLKTGADGSILAKRSISGLNTKGFLYNQAEEKVTKGIQLVDMALSGSPQEMTHTLSCVRVITSSNKDTKFGEILTLGKQEWTSKWREGDEDAAPKKECAKGVMSGRYHMGREQGDTMHKCAEFNTAVAIERTPWSTMFRECGIPLSGAYVSDKGRYQDCNEADVTDWESFEYRYFTCPVDQVMVGRGHAYQKYDDTDDTGNDRGDENGRTDYRCAKLYEGVVSESNRISVLPGKWTDPITEDGSDHHGDEHDGYFNCPANEVLVGRAHRGDERNLTRYQCAKLRLPAH
ncbi:MULTISPECIES: hypothetical protein [Pseudomonas]|uniref:hypothetical protein n=1 Tax=Pseudomonas TaxID=286 RepID=UPI0007618620|nr:MULTISPECIES: hypothetical protein [Pseudomonas]WBM45313.1 hypothetical protein M2J85_21780 [Pseudomonas putida]